MLSAFLKFNYNNNPYPLSQGMWEGLRATALSRDTDFLKVRWTLQKERCTIQYSYDFEKKWDFHSYGVDTIFNSSPGPIKMVFRSYCNLSPDLVLAHTDEQKWEIDWLMYIIKSGEWRTSGTAGSRNSGTAIRVLSPPLFLCFIVAVLAKKICLFPQSFPKISRLNLGHGMPWNQEGVGPGQMELVLVRW